MTFSTTIFRPGVLNGIFKIGALYVSELVQAIQSLFQNNEQGVWYDPSDFSTMFQDSVGTTPVTAVGQPVGLILDKRLGSVRGPEIITDPQLTNNNNPVEWNAAGTGGANTITFSGGQVTFVTDGTNISINKVLSVEAGKYYEVIISVTAQTVTVPGIFTGAADISFGSGTGVKRIIYTPIGTTTLTIKRIGGAGSFTLDSISVKELPGNHATQATAASRPVLARHPASGLRNLLTFTEEFDNTAAWLTITARPTITANFAEAPNGTMTAERITFLTSGFNAIAENIPVSTGTNYTFSLFVKANTLSSGTLRIWIDGALPTTPLIITPTADWVRYSVTSSTTNTTARVQIGASSPLTAADVLIWGAQFELGSSATTYQKVTTANDVTEAGQPDLHYLKFDGVDDWLQTAAIDFTGTDKMNVFAGIRKTADAAPTQVLVELSVASEANNGTFRIAAPLDTRLQFRSRGTITADANILMSGVLLGQANMVLTGIGDISGDFSRLRANGSAFINTISTDQGTGNYGNYPLFIGRRGGTTLPFNGHLYGLVVRGALSTDTQINEAERYMGAKTGVVIPV